MSLFHNTLVMYNKKKKRKKKEGDNINKIVSCGVLSKIKTDDKRLMREGEKGHLESVAE